MHCWCIDLNHKLLPLLGIYLCGAIDGARQRATRAQMSIHLQTVSAVLLRLALLLA
jgi:hypothetical protein